MHPKLTRHIEWWLWSELGSPLQSGSSAVAALGTWLQGSPAGGHSLGEVAGHSPGGVAGYSLLGERYIVSVSTSCNENLLFDTEG